MTSSKEPLYFGGFRMCFSHDSVTVHAKMFLCILIPVVTEGSCSNSGDEDDATDVESSDEEEEDVAISREKCEKWIPPVFLKARGILEI